MDEDFPTEVDMTVDGSTHVEIIEDQQVGFDEGQNTAAHTDVAESESSKAANAQLSVEIPTDVPTTPTVVPQALVPSLIGKMTYVGGIVYCKGVWAMSDANHGVPGQTSDFEFKLAVAEEGSVPGTFPINGKYSGWFALKQPPPLKGHLKIEDKDMILTFTNSENGEGHNISGSGHNKFGSFNLRGTLTVAGDVHLYREYTSLTPHPVPVSHAKRKYSFGGDAGSEPKKKSNPVGNLSVNKVKVESGAATPGAVSTVSEGVTPRGEGTGRVRKMSSLMKEYEDSNALKSAAAAAAAAAAATPKPVQRAVTQPLPAAVPMVRQESASDRAQRLSAPLKKCGEILKELSKHPQGMWFLEPVDPIKFNIPDYALIIKNPMDFGTIRKNLEGMKYDSHEAFAEHVRLVFRNAITFNAARDNPVHIAAREMSSRFEDRYRHVISQLGVYSRDSLVDLIDVGKGSTGRQSLGGAVKKKAPVAAAPKYAAPIIPGPRPPVAYLPPAAGDSSSHQIMEMQRMMSMMQNEINSLRSAVRETEIVKRLSETQDAAHNPLTFDEKKKLIAQIHKLPPNKMEHVLDIIQAAIPKNEGDESGDIEVPLDALDTFTLRKLQKFIEDSAPKKKPPVAGVPPLQRQSSASSSKGAADPNAVKKPRKSASKANVSGMLLGDAELDLLHEDDFLFSTDSFEELRGQGAGGDAVHTPAASSTSMAPPAPVAAPAAPAFSTSSFEAEISRQQASNPGDDDFRRQRAGSLDEDFSDLMDSKPTSATSAGASGGWETVSAPAPSGTGSLFAAAVASMQTKKEGEDELRRQYM